MKGRSSSWQLNWLLRQSLVTHLSHGCKPFYGYIRSQFNPGDDPTRGVVVREPVVEEAAWLTRLKEGEPGGMDDFLVSIGLGLRQMAGLPDPNELLADAPYDYRRAKEVRSDRGRARRGAQARRSMPENSGHGEVVQDSSHEDSVSDEPRLGRDGRTLEPTGPCSRAIEPPQTATGRDGRTLEPTGPSPRAREAVKSPLERRLKGITEVVEEQSGYNWEALAKLFRRSQFVYSSKFPDLETALQSGPGLLGLFSGARGFAKSFTQTATSWAVCFDLKHHEDENLLDPHLQRTFLLLISKGFFRAMASSPVCASFSTAITPPWRTLAFPAGRPDLTAEQRAKIEIGQAQLSFTLQLVRACLQFKLVFWVENPGSSWFWRQKGELSWDDVLTDAAVDFLVVDQCRFGTAWKKRTKFLTNSHLAGQKAGCLCQKPHTVLRGRCRERKMNFTKLAESYPRALCSVLGSAVAIDSGMVANRRRLDIGACAKAATLKKKIGEATNPGPRRRRQERTADLEQFELLEPQTVAMRQKFWLDFTHWIEHHLGPGSLHWCLAAPILLVKVLEAYGYEQFKAGFPLHYYRQLAAHVQREFPLVRPYINIAWAVVNKWKHFEPVQHRTPMPEPLLRAGTSLAMEESSGYPVAYFLQY